MGAWVHEWDEALVDRVHELAAYELGAYEEYLRWYSPRTRTTLVLPADVDAPAVVPEATDTYPVHLAQEFTSAVLHFVLPGLGLRMCQHGLTILFTFSGGACCGARQGRTLAAP